MGFHMRTLGEGTYTMQNQYKLQKVNQIHVLAPPPVTDPDVLAYTGQDAVEGLSHALGIDNSAMVSSPLLLGKNVPFMSLLKANIVLQSLDSETKLSPFKLTVTKTTWSQRISNTAGVGAGDSAAGDSAAGDSAADTAGDMSRSNSFLTQPYPVGDTLPVYLPVFVAFSATQQQAYGGFIGTLDAGGTAGVGAGDSAAGDSAADTAGDMSRSNSFLTQPYPVGDTLPVYLPVFVAFSASQQQAYGGFIGTLEAGGTAGVGAGDSAAGDSAADTAGDISRSNSFLTQPYPVGDTLPVYLPVFVAFSATQQQAYGGFIGTLDAGGTAGVGAGDSATGDSAAGDSAADTAGDMSRSNSFLTQPYPVGDTLPVYLPVFVAFSATQQQAYGGFIGTLEAGGTAGVGAGDSATGDSAAGDSAADTAGDMSRSNSFLTQPYPVGDTLPVYLPVFVAFSATQQQAYGGFIRTLDAGGTAGVGAGDSATGDSAAGDSAADTAGDMSRSNSFLTQPYPVGDTLPVYLPVFVAFSATQQQAYGGFIGTLEAGGTAGVGAGDSATGDSAAGDSAADTAGDMSRSNSFLTQPYPVGDTLPVYLPVFVAFSATQQQAYGGFIRTLDAGGTAGVGAGDSATGDSAAGDSAADTAGDMSRSNSFLTQPYPVGDTLPVYLPVFVAFSATQQQAYGGFIGTLEAGGTAGVGAGDSATGDSAAGDSAADTAGDMSRSNSFLTQPYPVGDTLPVYLPVFVAFSATQQQAYGGFIRTLDAGGTAGVGAGDSATGDSAAGDSAADTAGDMSRSNSFLTQPYPVGDTLPVYLPVFVAFSATQQQAYGGFIGTLEAGGTAGVGAGDSATGDSAAGDSAADTAGDMSRSNSFLTQPYPVGDTLPVYLPVFVAFSATQQQAYGGFIRTLDAGGTAGVGAGDSATGDSAAGDSAADTAGDMSRSNSFLTQPYPVGDTLPVYLPVFVAFSATQQQAYGGVIRTLDAGGTAGVGAGDSAAGDSAAGDSAAGDSAADTAGDLSRSNSFLTQPYPVGDTLPVYLPVFVAFSATQQQAYGGFIGTLEAGGTAAVGAGDSATGDSAAGDSAADTAGDMSRSNSFLTQPYPVGDTLPVYLPVFVAFSATQQQAYGGFIGTLEAGGTAGVGAGDSATGDSAAGDSAADTAGDMSRSNSFLTQPYPVGDTLPVYLPVFVAFSATQQQAYGGFIGTLEAGGWGHKSLCRTYFIPNSRQFQMSTISHNTSSCAGVGAGDSAADTAGDMSRSNSFLTQPYPVGDTLPVYLPVFVAFSATQQQAYGGFIGTLEAGGTAAVGAGDSATGDSAAGDSAADTAGDMSRSNSFLTQPYPVGDTLPVYLPVFVAFSATQQQAYGGFIGTLEAGGTAAVGAGDSATGDSAAGDSAADTAGDMSRSYSFLTQPYPVGDTLPVYLPVFVAFSATQQQAYGGFIGTLEAGGTAAVGAGDSATGDSAAGDSAADTAGDMSRSNSFLTQPYPVGDTLPVYLPVFVAFSATQQQAYGGFIGTLEAGGTAAVGAGDSATGDSAAGDSAADTAGDMSRSNSFLTQPYPVGDTLPVYLPVFVAFSATQQQAYGGFIGTLEAGGTAGVGAGDSAAGDSAADTAGDSAADTAGDLSRSNSFLTQPYLLAIHSLTAGVGAGDSATGDSAAGDSAADTAGDMSRSNSFLAQPYPVGDTLPVYLPVFVAFSATQQQAYGGFIGTLEAGGWGQNLPYGLFHDPFSSVISDSI
ncbi:uncharacterized PE-PGRS family protein PE_PGRS54-like [Mytilus trossulus]|uniref:uncharacterized PE-PGRS family protein PE_PGRS54-like n=1 Tax=Mytilus trossulus TaxID=6551 RepID=UPI0030076CB4